MSRVYGRQMVEQRVVTETRCDGCGKVQRGTAPDDWAHFNSHHNDWDNDSIESSEWWDACSGACYLKIVAKVVEDYGTQRQPTLSVDDKSYAFACDLILAGRSTHRTEETG